MSDREYDRGFEDGAQSRNAEVDRLRAKLTTTKDDAPHLALANKQLREELGRVREGWKREHDDLKPKLARLSEAMNIIEERLSTEQRDEPYRFPARCQSALDIARNAIEETT